MTGKMWAFEHFVEPDIACFGKKSQVCGLIAGTRIDQVPDNVFKVSSRLNSTWGGNLVDMVCSRIHLERRRIGAWDSSVHSIFPIREPAIN